VQLATQQEIRDSYQGRDVAVAYVEQRFTNELMHLLHCRQVAAVQSVFDRHKPAAALELAPGPGRVTRDVRPSGQLTCLEFNDGMIAEGMAACLNGAEWVQGDAFRLPFNQQFQFVYSFRFIRHFHRPERDKLYEQIRNVLDVGGLLVVDAVNERVSGPLRRAKPANYPIYDKLYSSEQELTDELHDNGFEIVRLEPVQRWFSLQSRAQVMLGPRSNRLCRWAIHALEHLRRGPALEWIVECRRA
jgi:ubiquinone/menaquinone biosynthesis C-methylase UbiE